MNWVHLEEETQMTSDHQVFQLLIWVKNVIILWKLPASNNSYSDLHIRSFFHKELRLMLDYSAFSARFLGDFWETERRTEGFTWGRFSSRSTLSRFRRNSFGRCRRLGWHYCSGLLQHSHHLILRGWLQREDNTGSERAEHGQKN